MSYENYLNRLKENPSPGELSEIKMKLAAEFALRSEELAQILVLKAKIWIVEREKHPSDKSTDQAWNASPEGNNELLLRFRLRGLEKILSSISTRLRVLEIESHNQF